MIGKIPSSGQLPIPERIEVRGLFVRLRVEAAGPSDFWSLGENLAVKMIVVDDHEFVRAGVISLIRARHADWTIGEAANGAQAIRLASTAPLDIAVIDISMPDTNGLDLCRDLIQLAPGVRIVIYSFHSSPQLIAKCRQAGANAYITKSDPPETLLNAIDAVVAGGNGFISSSLRDEISASSVGAPLLQAVLTTRELEVARLLAGGYTNKDIARRLGLSVRTVESHRSHLFSKLRITSIAELTKFAIRDGIC